MATDTCGLETSALTEAKGETSEHACLFGTLDSNLPCLAQVEASPTAKGAESLSTARANAQPLTCICWVIRVP